MQLARELVAFINKSPSPFHAVRSAKEAFLAQGFQELHETDDWSAAVKPNARLLMTKNGSTLYAVCIGGEYKPGNGFTMFGAHTDSPCLRVKPVSERTSQSYVQTAVETYGGGLWYTWFDRDLSLAGRCLVRKGEMGVEQHLVHLDRPVAIIPSLAIHLNREVNKGFAPNPETELVPVLYTTGASNFAMDETSASSYASTVTSANNNNGGLSGARHPPALLAELARELQCQPSDILDMDMCFAPHEPALVGGLQQEFVFAPRLDNLFNTFCGMRAMIESMDTLAKDTHIRMAVFFDHEEIGSLSAQGADSALTGQVMRRLLAALNAGMADYELAISRSFLVSADQAHAVHPNYSDKHERAHKISMNGGPVLKFNQNQRYATNSLTASIMRVIASSAQVPVQEFVVRQDTSCGSTIGPILSGQLGVYTVDMGSAQLAMHSAREMCSCESVSQAIKLYSQYFRSLPEVLASALKHHPLQ